jgi:YihY family inner membrane protein
MGEFSDKRALAYIFSHPWAFFKQVVRCFNANQGLLLSGAVAYYTLLSIIPLFTLLLVVLSNIVDAQDVLDTVSADLDLLVPGLSHTLVPHIAHFLENRQVVGWAGFLMLLFFSSLAFTVLESAMSVIFFHRVTARRRHFWVSATLPYLCILVLGLGLLLVTSISGALESIEDHQFILLGEVWSLDGLVGLSLYLLGIGGIIMLLTSIYIVMPVGNLSLRHALIGGITAGILWELARRLLVWYFANLSVVNMVYGSLATAVVALLSLEVAAMILLFGAQVIAEYERLAQGGKETIEPMRT